MFTCLENRFDVSGFSLLWFKSYLTSKNMSLRKNTYLTSVFRTTGLKFRSKDVPEVNFDDVYTLVVDIAS